MPIRNFFAVLILFQCCSLTSIFSQENWNRSPVRGPAHAVRESLDDVQLHQIDQSERRDLSLREAILIALQQSDVVNVLDGGVRTATASAYDTEIARANVYEQTGIFDPRLAIGYEGSQINRPPNSFFGPGIQERTRRDEGNFKAGIERRLTPGTTLSANYDPGLGYLYLPNGVNPGEFNPAHAAVFELKVEQPLLQGAGRDVNLAAIRIAKAREEQSIWEFQEATNAQLRSVCEAYWTLHAAYERLRAVESVLPLAYESRRIERLRFEAERTIYADLARAEVQLEGFLRQRIRALADVRSRALELNQLLGLAAAEVVSLVPSDHPFAIPLTVDVEAAHSTAMSRRPEILSLRKELEAESLQLDLVRNALLPELDLTANYWTSGLGDRLDDALDQSASLDYTSWTIGINFSIPLGNRSAQGRVQAQEFALVRDRIELTRTEERVRYEVSEIVTNLEAAWQRYESSVRQQKQAKRWLEVSRVRYSNPPEAGTDRNWLLLALSDYQTAMQTLIDTNTEAADLLAEYNILLARLDEVQGVSRDRWQVNVVDANNAATVNPSISPAVTADYRSAAPYGHAWPVQQAVHRDRSEAQAVSLAPMVDGVKRVQPENKHLNRAKPIRDPQLIRAGHSFRSPLQDYRNTAEKR